ncbi:DUF262 domain-containing protein [Pseudoclavibacter chungangensis]|uniref:DUF262 domain-containing protein n=1 Tax=Pseudoclavibacter chungangensis TaxID=587635 RepID=A0A7J5BMR2_9MICO|nr:DUF262 domain-containing protein [Pseudoclavibacter chungangensis]KAB1651994.1 DUF262 domain-containing protein [Pseudoclavibacter chungangensis]NYJ68783.1 uncharacterized protein with ParB-like and HNH nuclease domain/alkylated DNA nucleotide flippase Atl1 [Pseudoclavibacter chungangensis]
MKAVDTNLMELLKKAHRFVVPIYQRVYSWDLTECEQLWDDIERAGSPERLANHFTGSIVYIESDEGTRTSREPDLIIDGQQRVTTVTLLLAALAARLDELPDDQQEPIDGFSPRKIRGIYLTNEYESGDAYFKLILTQADKEALKDVIRHGATRSTDSRVFTNFTFFVEKLREATPEELATICSGLDKLVVVDVKLTRGSDDPQLVFESMNATGKKLSQADLIRNFVLMDLPPTEQERLYESQWFPMETLFRNEPSRFDQFVRHFLTVTSGTIPRRADIYDAFKAYASQQFALGVTRASLVDDLARYARWYAAMALGQEQDTDLAHRFTDLDELTDVAYPLQLRLYADYAAGILDRDQFIEILDTVISYVFRRAACRIPTNSLNNTMATITTIIDDARYAESIAARLLTFPDYRRFPTDEEFIEALTTSDIYSFQRRTYLLDRLENHGRKERVSVAEYTIEHIMPQNANSTWQEALGVDWQAVHKRFLHTLGNLTLTGYNPEYSDRPFEQKRDMQGGFRESPLRLNRGLGQLPEWGENQIRDRAHRLALNAVEIWPRPIIEPIILTNYRHDFEAGRRFDWSELHTILENLPAGRWTSYYLLAEVVGTSAQALAGHLQQHHGCPHAYRVLSWNGHVADGFRWTDPTDTRNPKDVLMSEGVRFEGDVADLEQQLTVDDLRTLNEGNSE